MDENSQNLKPNKLFPLKGPQTMFLASAADIVIYGGAAGGGKSYSLLLEPLRHFDNGYFGGVIFRRTTKQVTNQGGLWDESSALYPTIGGTPRLDHLEWVFPSGMRVRFAHMEHEKNVYDWQGAQIPFIGFDELTHFTEHQFWYMLSRNRSTTGIPAYVRATCNADADSWVRKLIDWWIDPKTGYPIPERAGALRYFVRINDRLHWADSPQTLVAEFPDSMPKSMTFVPAKLEDNPILMEKDPRYRANLDALPLVERMRLKEGNWNVRPAAGMYFQKQWFSIVRAAPVGKAIRYWDRAATEATQKNKDPDWTVGLRLVRDKQGMFFVTDVIRLRESPHKVEQAILNAASQDGQQTQIFLEQDPGQAGVAEVKRYAQLLAGYDVRFARVTQDKQTRARGVSAQAEAGNVKLIEAPWNEEFLRELQSFPESKHDDQVDALSGAFNSIILGGVGVFTETMAESQNTSMIDGDFSNW